MGDQPHDQAEDQLREIWRSVLGDVEIGPDDNFFELGGDSLGAAIMSLAIQQAFGQEVGAGQIYTTPTLRGLADHIRAGQAG